MHERNGGDLHEWLTLLFEEQLIYKYFGVRGDEPFADFCFLLYGPNPGQEINGLRELWTLHREEILQARDEMAPQLEVWAERFDHEQTQAGE